MVDEAPAAHVMRTELTNFYDECWPLQNNKTFVFFFVRKSFWTIFTFDKSYAATREGFRGKNKRKMELKFVLA